MRKLVLRSLFLLACLPSVGVAQGPPDTKFLEEFTWDEVRDLIKGGTTSVILATAGTDPSVKSAEAVLHQDLNGDGVISGGGAAQATTVSGTAGNGVLFGNGGNNTFVFAGNFGKDTVADFHAATDVLQFDHTAFTDVADVLAHAAQAGADVTVTVDATHSVTLSNTVLSQQDPYNVHLV